MLFALVAYLVGTASLCALVLFLGKWVPAFSIDNGVTRPLAQALLINCGLLALWTVQHIGMARRSFKQALSRVLPEALERSTYVLFTGLTIGLIVWLWSPISATVFSIEHTALVRLTWGLFAFGWLYVVSGILYDSYFEFHGLKQPYRYLTGKPFVPASFKTGFLFRLSRRPSFFGFLIVCWSTPHMSVGHLVFALGMSAFILVGCYFVERSYVENYGEAYRQMQAQTPLIIPNPLLLLSRKRN